LQEKNESKRQQARHLLKTADLALALSLEAIRGELGAFDARLHEEGRPYLGQIDCAANVRRLTDGSLCLTDAGREAFGGDSGPRVQDAISFRAAPQTHGGVRDMIDRLDEILDGNEPDLLLTLSLDTASIALADLATISERRSFRLNDNGLSYGLPSNLAASSSGVNHGFPVLQAVATALTAEAKRLAVPSAALGLSGKTALFASWERLGEIADLLEGVLTVEILMACQAMDLVFAKAPHLQTGRGTTQALRRLRKNVPFASCDRFFRDDLEKTQQLVARGDLLDAAEAAIGGLD
jgi:histidine ammonia-lyase